MTTQRLVLTAFFVGQILAAAPALAQEATPDDQHSEDSGQAIVVVGRLVGGGHDPISAPAVLQGDALLRDTRPQIGQMLENLPGVSASGFAPGASRPVLRGFDGPRVQVLTDGLGSLDASSVSGDHAVSLDTLNVDRVDVLHGPQVLLYASDPAGGAVNALDKRIPRRMPDGAVDIDLTGSFGTASDSVEAGGAVDIALAPRWVARFNGGYSHAGDLSIGGDVLSPQLRADTLADAASLRISGDLAGADELTTQANASGRLANSWAKQYSFGAGLAFIDDGGTLGVSVSRLASDYGIPPRPAVGDPDPVSISLRQTRIDMRAGLELGDFLDRLELRTAYGDYHHAELDAGVPATQFASKGIEARLEAVQARRGIWSGTSGIQYGARSLDITGDELLLPNTRSTRFAAFTLQRLTLSAVDVELATRYDRAGVRAMGGRERQFDLWSGVAGLAWHPADRVTVSLSYSRGERAPEGEELFIDGIHDATQSYERGNPAFTTERSNGVEGGIRYQSPGLVLALTAYLTDFSDFITAVPTGAEIEGFPVYQFIQAPARFRGIEAEASVTLAEWGPRKLSLDGGVDYTHAELTGIGPVPRIPTLRVRSGLEFATDAFSLRGEVEWNARQDRVSANENPTEVFTLLNLSANWKPLGADAPLTLVLSGDNLFNASGRRAASETRDFVPIAGRDIRLTAKLSF